VSGVLLLVAKLLGVFVGGALAGRFAPRRSSLAYRKGWQAAAWEILQAVQTKHSQIRAEAVASSKRWLETKEGQEGKPNPDPAQTASLTVNLDDVRGMAETILRNPPKRERAAVEVRP
jgi:hypothetical protein